MSSHEPLDDAPRGDLSVLELNTRVKQLLEIAFPYPVWVRGEIARTPRSNPRGHLYFQLIDPSPSGGQPEATVDCALFAGSRIGVERRFRDAGTELQLLEGMSVRVMGRPDLWPPAGRYQFVVQDVDPAWTQGEQALRLRRIARKLSSEGLLELNRSLEMPTVPLSIGLVTASDSAALRDFMRTLEESGFPFRVLIAPATMQGVTTPAEIVGALAALAASPPRLDAVILTRGGGSATDLAWLNDERLGRAIAAAPWPVVSGIGHEIDTTLPDLVSHTRAKTPTHAATLLVNRVADFLELLDQLAGSVASSALPGVRIRLERLDHLRSSLVRSSGYALRSRHSALSMAAVGLAAGARERLRAVGIRLDGLVGLLRALVVPTVIRPARRRLCDLAEGLIAGAAAPTRRLGARLGTLEDAVRAGDPVRLLAKGWAIARDRSGRVVSRVGDTGVGERLEVSISDGRLSTTVEAVSEESESSKHEEDGGQP
ncbi:exodeoxyribonuclease VII large subunit [Candidatus Fermentibacterales bacterium]|nr:exodeoxyribonuclease VII large subunit [Candidatus Fermentibacterales bacterium]